MPKSILEEKVQQIRYRDRIIVLLGLILGGLVIALILAPSQIDIHRIPDASRLLVHGIQDVPKTSVHSFARLAIESMNQCGKNCSDEIPANIDALRAYVSEDCRAKTKAHITANPNLYSSRSRELKYVFDASTQGTPQFIGESPLGNSEQTVRIIDDHTWTVDLNYKLLETVAGYETINADILYPILIKRTTKPRNINEYGLEFDCFYGQISRTNETKGRTK